MLFSKLKPKSDELLPPPPPFPSMELEDEKISKRASPKKTPKDDEFEGLFKEVESLGKKESKKTIPRPAKEKKASIKLPKEKIQVKKQPIKLPKLKKGILSVKKPAAAKEQKKVPKHLLKKQKVSIKAAKPKDSGFKEPGPEYQEVPESGEIKLEHELEIPEERKEPESLKDFDIGREFPQKDFEFDIQSKPREIQEAENEIRSAIEKIRDREKPSFLKRLFARRENGKELPQIYEKDDVSAVNNRISKARESLMKFDLNEARQNYIEAMRIYKRMIPEAQAKVYREINDLYYERKSAEQLRYTHSHN